METGVKSISEMAEPGMVLTFTARPPAGAVLPGGSLAVTRKSWLSPSVAVSGNAVM